jgi:hypothetical protein
MRRHRPVEQQLRANRHDAADVVGDDGGTRKGPEVEQGGEPLCVSSQRDVLFGLLGGSPEPEQIEDEHGEALGQGAGDAPPRPDDHGVPWTSTTGGPCPNRSQAMSPPSVAKRSRSTHSATEAPYMSVPIPPAVRGGGDRASA